MLRCGPPVLAAGGAVLASIPTAIVAFVLYRALGQATRPRELALAALILALALGLRIALASAAGRRIRRALNELAERARVEVLEGSQRLPGRRVREIDAGRVVALLTTGLDEAIGVYGDAFEAIFSGISTALLLFVLLAFIDWRISLVALGFAPLTAIYLRVAQDQFARRAASGARACRGHLALFRVRRIGRAAAHVRTHSRNARNAWPGRCKNSRSKRSNEHRPDSVRRAGVVFRRVRLCDHGDGCNGSQCRRRFCGDALPAGADRGAEPFSNVV